MQKTMDQASRTLVLNSLILEYKNSFDRSNRLDNFTKGLRYVVCTVILAFAGYGVQILLAVHQ